MGLREADRAWADGRCAGSCLTREEAPAKPPGQTQLSDRHSRRPQIRCLDHDMHSNTRVCIIVLPWPGHASFVPITTRTHPAKLTQRLHHDAFGRNSIAVPLTRQKDVKTRRNQSHFTTDSPPSSDWGCPRCESCTTL
jgi:hypothetical protein